MKKVKFNEKDLDREETFEEVLDEALCSLMFDTEKTRRKYGSRILAAAKRWWDKREREREVEIATRACAKRSCEWYDRGCCTCFMSDIEYANCMLRNRPKA